MTSETQISAGTGADLPIFPNKPKNNRYPQEWKAAAIAYVQAERAKGLALYAICSRIKMHESAICRWFADAGLPRPSRVQKNKRHLQKRSPNPSITRAEKGGPIRRCLGADCGRMFWSWGPGNRLCENCR